MTTILCGCHGDTISSLHFYFDTRKFTSLRHAPHRASNENAIDLTELLLHELHTRVSKAS